MLLIERMVEFKQAMKQKGKSQAKLKNAILREERADLLFIISMINHRIHE
jgi:hypothetical protein